MKGFRWSQESRLEIYIAYGPHTYSKFVLTLCSTVGNDRIIQLNLNSSNTDGSFTMANFKLVFQSLRNSSDSSRKQIFKEIFLFYHDIVCCVYSLELSNFCIEDQKDFPKLLPFVS